MRLVLAIGCFLLGTVSFWIAFHPVKSQPTPSSVLAGVKDAVTKGTVASAGTSGDETAGEAGGQSALGAIGGGQ